MSHRAWQKFHSLPSFALNTKLLDSRERSLPGPTLDRMIDDCTGCHDDNKLRTGERACPYNSLYGEFFTRNAENLSTNPRQSMVYQQLAKMDAATRRSLPEQADELRNSQDRL